MAGKAEAPADEVTYAKMMNAQTEQTYGLLRSQDQGAPVQRSYSIGTSNDNYEQGDKLSIRGGVMLGSLGFKTIGTSQLAATGILDTNDYNTPRLTINNNWAYTLKVLIPTIANGQEIWISALVGQSWTIQNTSGNGDETTGNIELLQGTDYSMSGNDWICFQYDAVDEKFHQVSAGINDVGGGSSGEVFTWTNNHASGGNDLVMGSGDITFGIGGTTKFNANDSIFLLNVNSTEIMRANSSLWQVATSFYPKTDSTYTLGTSSRYWSHGYIDQITMTGGDLNNPGHIYQLANDRHYFGSGGNYIMQSSSNGYLEFRTNSTSVGHSFFVGSMRMNINKDTIEVRNPIDMSANKILDVTFIQSDTSVGFTENYIRMGSTTLQMSIVAGGSTLEMKDSTGAFFSSGSTSLVWSRTQRPLLPDQYDLGTSVYNFQNLFLARSLVLEDYYASGHAPATVTGHGQLFIRDNGSGKSQLRVKFNGTPSQEIITET